MSTSDTPVAPRTRTPRWIKILLVFSLALNLLVVGVIAGAALHFGRGHGWMDGDRSRHLSWFVRHLPEDRRSRVEQILKTYRAQVRPLRQQMRAARKAAMDAITAEPFDKATYLARTNTYRTLKQQVHEVRNNALPDLIAELSPEERKKLVEWQRHRASWRRRWHRSTD